MNQWDGTNDSTDLYNGNIAYCKAFDHPLTESEIEKIYAMFRDPWYKRLWRWLRNVFHRLTYRKTISSVRFIVPPGYPDDTYSIEDIHLVE